MRKPVITIILLLNTLFPPVFAQDGEPGHDSQSAPINVVFLSPDNSRFWGLVGGFMQAVASDLELDLTIRTDQEKNRLSYRELLGQVLSQPELPDYIVFMCKEKVTHDMLTMIGEAGVKAFTFNTDVPDDEIALTGEPRAKMDHWIGHLSPDNRSAGLLLARQLHDRSKHQTGKTPGILVGLSGSRDSSAAVDRNSGLGTMLEAHPDLHSQVLFSNWDELEAEEKMERLIDRYPTLELVWNASDGMALGAIRAAETKGRTPGSDIFFGGIDWEARALDEIENGRLALSLGRHFMGGGLALLLIRDYHAGFDFAGEGTVSMKYRLVEANRDNVAAVRQVMDPNRWRMANFRQFSKHYTASRRSQPVTASGLLDDFMGALSPGVASGISPGVIDTQM